jgi:hypothetical protein
MTEGAAMTSRRIRQNANKPTASAPESTDISREMFGLTRAQSFTEIDRYLYYVAWSADGTTLAATGQDGYVGTWALADGQSRRLNGHTGMVLGLAWHPARLAIATGAEDGTIRLWDAATGSSEILHQQEGWTPSGIAWSPDGQRLAVTDNGGNLAIWDVANRTRLSHIRAHKSISYNPCWSPGGLLITSSPLDNTTVHSADDYRLIRQLEGHVSQGTFDTALSPDGKLLAAAEVNQTVRIWQLTSGKLEAVLEGHTSSPASISFSSDGRFLASMDGEMRLWRCRDWECVATIPRNPDELVGGLDFHPAQPLLAVKNQHVEHDKESKLGARIELFALDVALLDGVGQGSDSRRYANAKVILLGDTGVGKSGLGLVLSGQPYRATDSTHGRHVWTMDSQEVDTPAGGTQAREILLWDLAGQPGYRLVHQLHLGETAVALLVFDSRSETDPFSGVKHWVRALAQARRLEGSSTAPLRAYLVAARADRGGVAVSQERVQAMLDDLDLDGFFETSAKEGWQIADLARAVRDGIVWDALPMVSSSVLFGLIKDFLIEEKEQGRLLSTIDDLFRGFQRAQPDTARDPGLRASFETCVGRVESRGLIRRLHFGDLILLQPELLDSYASAMVQAAKEEPDGLGFISEENALEGRFRLGEDERVNDRAQEKLLLIATVEELLRHEIALKATTDRGVNLVFPSQFTRERPDAPDIPGKQVTFTFDGPLYSIYATLAVRLSHSALFHRQAMWQNAASYASVAGGTCGIHLRELEEGRGELALFYDGQAGAAARAQFETYVAEHLQLRALPGTLTRQQTRMCPDCDYVLPEDMIQRRIKLGAFTIRCPVCEASVISLQDQPSARPEAAIAQMNRNADDRRDRNVAATRLKGKVETSDYDVFLCYNSRDEQRVKAIGERLKELGILPWLDLWEIRPGTRWQQELQKQIKSIRSAAVFIGPKGQGPWQEMEVEAFLSQLAKRKCPIIPVILEGRRGRPQLPPFLTTVHMVDMRQPDPDPFRQLVWGITGERRRSPAV